MSELDYKPDALLCCMGQVMAPPIQITAGGIRWWLAPECREPLFGPEGLRLEQWLRDGRACVVKQGQHRSVYRIELPELRCHLKHNRIADFRSWLRGLVRPSKARTEYRRALKVAQRGVPTIVPLALGEECRAARPRDSFLLTRTLDGTMMLHAFVETKLPTLPPTRQARLRQRLAVRLGEFLARIHHAGVLHRDLHCGNILVQLNPSEEPYLYLVDLQAVQLRPPLDWSASRENLVVLNRWPSLYASRSDRLRFWHAYCRARTALAAAEPGSPGLPPAQSVSSLARQLEKQTDRSNRVFWRRRDRRCLERNRYYRPIRSGSVSGHAVTDLDMTALTALLADPDAPFRQPAQPLLKDSPSSTVAELQMLVAGQPRRVIYKRFGVTRPHDLWTGWLRRPPALRSWVYGQGLRERGLPTARPLAVFHRRCCGLWYEGYILFEKIEGALDLRGTAEHLAKADEATRRGLLRPLLEELARVVRELHQRQLSHRDLKAANVLVQLPAQVGGRPRCWLIDLVGVSLYRRLPRAIRIKNLARLHASFYHHPLLSRADKLRFLRIYLQWGLRGGQRWKSWWRAIARATEAKAARNARLGRPLA
jgi:tRNA A-37 threonylcarbamoyl transferase component Bud32